jgi:16S rRNA (cytosine1402-N4)-methyltransferase
MTDDPRFELIRGEIAQLGTYLRERDLEGKVDGILLDLGVSSPQLDEAERGFSFMRDGPLDMRMDPDAGNSAAEWLATVDNRTLIQVLRKYGEEQQAPRIARAILAARDESPITRTVQLADIIEAAVPRRGSRKHPATKTFQAIRIVVNRELEQLETLLESAIELLSKGGRLCVISFHSLEDRMVKRFMRDASRESEQYRGMPNVPAAFRPKLKLIGKAIVATAEEIEDNVRARSARLRVAERL